MYNIKPIDIKILAEVKSQYQHIELIESMDYILLLLDGHAQFVYPGEKIYHKALIDDAVNYLKRRPLTILIIGGGDGLACRNALRYTNDVYVVEIDPEIIKFAKTNPFLSTLNAKSLYKAKVFIQDAISIPKWIKADLIVIDLIDPINRKTKRLYSPSYIQALINNNLKEGGIISAYRMPALKHFGRVIVKRVFLPLMDPLDIWYYKQTSLF